MNLTGKLPTFRRQKPHTNPYRLAVLAVLVIGGAFLLRAVEREDIKSPFLPTPVPTRTGTSFALEGETHFLAGDLDSAIASYRKAVEIEPNNGAFWAELARIQAYSSALLTTDAAKAARLGEALESVNQAVAVAPDDSSAHALRAFVLDWNSNPILAGEESVALLTEAEQEAIRALQLDAQNTLALAYYAEILVDQQKLLQAEQYSLQAVTRDPSIMDVHRVNALVLETSGRYGDAINAYKRAAEITPNLTFLYLAIGVNYRELEQYEMALEYFAKAADINEQLGIQDPVPYLAIGRTYAQMGEFFIAARNVERALDFSPADASMYGQLGIIYFKARNYESAIPALKCSVEGCDAAESCAVRQCNTATDPAIDITGLPLSDSTLEYYLYYSSVLAGMHRPNDAYCTTALVILRALRTQYSGNETVMEIVETNEQICSTTGG